MSRQSILTKFIPTSNSRGARIKAVQSGWNEKRDCKSLTIPYPHELNAEDAHALAASMLAEKLEWHGRFICASLGAWSDFSYCFAIDDQSGFDLTKEAE